ncbi:MAG TPA: 5'/3'-nucleotidase SurE [Vicinamibacterales bacterium]|nr:5'/3'-nucleotidase SurE [Vicinamibacterales bacterium]HWI20709.1 5'/3'-nucleotidase SurE [Vicinamibacterales bacterium]
MARPLILVTNDDGVNAPGLRAAALVAHVFGDVLVASTRDPQTAMGRSYPKTPDTGIIEEYDMRLDDGTKLEAYSIVASPAQAVSYAILELAPRMPDICVSGINFGENLGTTLTGSGTVGAAMEADSYNIPGIAISLQIEGGDTPEAVNWAPSSHFLARFLDEVITHGLPKGVSILNVNIPRNASESTEIRVTRDSRQPYFVFAKPKRLSRDQGAKLPVVVELNRDTLEPDSDIQALVLDHVVSVTPLSAHLASGNPWVPRFAK